jgi:hypothetical protein
LIPFHRTSSAYLWSVFFNFDCLQEIGGAFGLELMADALCAGFSNDDLRGGQRSGCFKLDSFAGSAVGRFEVNPMVKSDIRMASLF